MTVLVNVRSAKGRRTQFLVDERLLAKYPDDYVAVEPRKASQKKLDDVPVKTVDAVNVEPTKK